MWKSCSECQSAFRKCLSTKPIHMAEASDEPQKWVYLHLKNTEGELTGLAEEKRYRRNVSFAFSPWLRGDIHRRLIIQSWLWSKGGSSMPKQFLIISAAQQLVSLSLSLFGLSSWTCFNSRQEKEKSSLSALGVRNEAGGRRQGESDNKCSLMELWQEQISLSFVPSELEMKELAEAGENGSFNTFELQPHANHSLLQQWNDGQKPGRHFECSWMANETLSAFSLLSWNVRLEYVLCSREAQLEYQFGHLILPLEVSEPSRNSQSPLQLPDPVQSVFHVDHIWLLNRNDNSSGAREVRLFIHLGMSKQNCHECNDFSWPTQWLSGRLNVTNSGRT